MFKSLSQQNISVSPTTKHVSAPRSTTSPSMSKPRRPQLSHSKTLSSLPDSHKPSKSRPGPSGSFLASFFATFTPASSANGSPSPSRTASPGLKTHRSDAELRRDYLSPEREKEIGEIWDEFKRQSIEFGEDKFVSFPSITEYEYEDQEDDSQRDGYRRDTRRVVK
jgi:hypothetical protein